MPVRPPAPVALFFSERNHQSALGVHHSALPSLHDNTADQQEPFSNQTVTTVGHGYFRPLVNGTTPLKY